MLVLYTAHAGDSGDRAGSVGCLETAKSHRCANSRLPAHQLEDRTHLHGKGDKKHAHHGADASDPWDLFIHLYWADPVNDKRGAMEKVRPIYKKLLVAAVVFYIIASAYIQSDLYHRIGHLEHQLSHLT